MTKENYDADCKRAINLMLDDDWDRSHKIVQEINYNVAQWIHAVLHKIEGDVSNSKYWYKRSSLANYDDFVHPNDELLYILKYIENLSFSE